MASYDIIVKLVDQTKASMRSIETGLTSIQSRAEQVNKTLDKLGTGLEKSAKIASAALSGAALSAIHFADNISDTAKAADMSTAALIGLSKSFELNGGTADKAQQAALRFAQTVGDAASGSKVARDALDKVGISLNDIANVPTDVLLGKTVNALSQFGDQSRAASVSADIFGKTVKGVDFKGVSDSLADLTNNAKEYEGAVGSAADLVDNFSAAMGAAKLAILQAIKPAIDFINAIGPDRLAGIAKGVAAVGAALVTLWAGTKGAGILVAGFAEVAGILSKVVNGLGVLTGAATTASVATTALAASEAAAATAGTQNALAQAFLISAYARRGSAVTNLATAEARLAILEAEGVTTGTKYTQATLALASAKTRLIAANQGLTATEAELAVLQGRSAVAGTAAGAAAAANIGIFARLGAAMSAVVAAAAPIAIALGAIAAAVAVGTVIYRAFEDEIDNLLGTMWDFAKAVGGSIKDAVVGFFDWANSGLTSLAQGLRNVASALGLASKKDVSAVNYAKAPDQSAAETKRLAEAGQAASQLRDVVNVTMKAINDAIETAVQAAKDLGQSVSASAIDAARSAAVYDKLSSTMLMFGEVVKKPNDLIKRDFNITLAKNREELRQHQIIYSSTANIIAEYTIELDKATLELKKQSAILADAGIQQRIYNNELATTANQLKDTEQRLANSALQQGIYANEMKKTALEQQDMNQRLSDGALQQKIYGNEIANIGLQLKDQAQRLGDVKLQQALYSEEVAKGALALKDQEQRLANTALQQDLFNQNIQKSRNDLAQQKSTLDMLNKAYADGTISLQEYADALGGINTQLQGSKQLMARALNDANQEVKTIKDRKEALGLLIDKYKEAGGTGTAAFRKAAEALGGTAPAVQAVINKYGDYSEKIQEYNQDVEDSINKASSTFVDEFTAAFMKGEGMLDSFKNFFSNVMNDIAQNIIKKQLTEPIAAALNGMISDMMKSSGGIGGVLGNIFGGSGGAGSGGGLGGMLGGAWDSITSFFGFANGGMIGAGQVGLVGEKGPEFITGPANITPIDQNATKDTTPTVNFTINAIDTQTGVQFLLQNKPAIVSMVSQAYNERGRRGVNG